MKRDGYKCRRCLETKGLEVHHKYYLEDKLPWEVPDTALITLCRIHHQMAHEGRTIGSFIKKNKNKTKKRCQIKQKPKKKS